VTSTRRFVDLHAHSTASDGACPPAELVRLAEAKRLAAVALTDHDTLAGLAEARAEAALHPRLRLVEGIEVSARFTGGTLHILGLGIDPEAEELRRLAERLREARDERNPKMLARLRALGVPITMEDVLAEGSAPADGRPLVIGRMHFALALCRKGCATSVAEAFDRYLGDGAPAYVDKERIAPAEAIGAIRQAGGLAVLAHPVQLHLANRAQLERVVRELARHGLGAIEVYHTEHTPAQTRAFLDLARRLGLGVTGGSDFHGAAKPEAVLGRPRVPASVVPAGLLG